MSWYNDIIIFHIPCISLCHGSRWFPFYGCTSTFQKDKQSTTKHRLTFGYGSKPIVPYLGGWTSIYNLFWCSLGYHGFDPWLFRKNPWVSCTDRNPLSPSWSHQGTTDHWSTPSGTLWLFNIAMENDPFIDDVPIKTTIYRGILHGYVK